MIFVYLVCLEEGWGCAGKAEAIAFEIVLQPHQLFQSNTISTAIGSTSPSVSKKRTYQPG
ncbi:MAG: hypothetical protein A2189_02600 [Paenibacillus sp. RIFOXYA1_FULL_44_5]|nr:MAG: hypothetical protein A2189_02600 [Paenibacillus sp. RIFOXYA1_FULL_44_5]